MIDTAGEAPIVGTDIAVPDSAPTEAAGEGSPSAMQASEQATTPEPADTAREQTAAPAADAAAAPAGSTSAADVAAGSTSDEQLRSETFL